MDAQTALETQRHTPGAGCAEGLHLAQFNPDRVDRRFQPGGAAMQHHLGPGGFQHGLGKVPTHAEVERIVARAEAEALHPPAQGHGAGHQRRQCRHAARGFDDGHHLNAALRQPLVAFEVAHQPIHGDKLGRLFQFGQHQAIQWLGDHGLDVTGAEFGIEAIDPNKAAAGARPLERRAHQGPRGDLGGDRHRILKVENRGIGAGGEHLFGASGMVAWGEKEAAAGRGHRLVPWCGIR